MSDNFVQSPLGNCYHITEITPIKSHAKHKKSKRTKKVKPPPILEEPSLEEASTIISQAHYDKVELPQTRYYTPDRRKQGHMATYYEKIRMLQSSRDKYSTIKEKNRNISLVGAHAKLEYIYSYKNLEKVNQITRFNRSELSPVTSYLNKLSQRNLKPEPLNLVKRKGSCFDMDISSYGVGDVYAECLSEGIKQVQMKKLNVAGNRLSDKGGMLILNSLIPEQILEIDLSNNFIGEKCVQTLSELLKNRSAKIQILHLENNKLTDALVKKLSKGLSSNNTLLELNLARNNLSSIGILGISEFIKYASTLQKLDLHWNKISGEEAKTFCKALQQNESLRVLDLSWNSLSFPKYDNCAKILSEALRDHSLLFHLDLSYNNFKTEDAEILSEGIKTNHKIFGIHMEGNEATVDPLGFVSQKKGISTSRAHIYSRMIANNKVKHYTAWRECSRCWICERWSEVEFTWKPDVSGNNTVDPVFLHLDFDEYLPDLMEKHEDGVYRTFRMCPPSTVDYFFTVGGDPTIAEDKRKRELTRILCKDIELYPSCTVQVKLSVMNTLHNIKGMDLLQVNTKHHLLPRNPRRAFMPLNISKKRTWTIPISVFKEYKFDNEDSIAKCFEFDWTSSRIPKVIKDPVELNKVKESLRKIYNHLREAYKYYSCMGPQGEIWCIGQMAFTDFCNECKLIDNSNFRLADLDFNLKATQYSEVKNNPRNPANSLIRFQFMEILVRIAMDKFLKSGMVSTHSEAVDMIIKDHLLPIISKYDSNKFKWDYYIKEEIDIVFKKHLALVNAVYKQYSRVLVKPGQKPFMSLQEFNDLCNSAKLINDRFTAREVNFAFNLAIMTQINELDFDRHCQMTFVEFLEALGRVAHIGTPSDSNIPLQISLENLVLSLLKISPAYIQDTYEKTEAKNLPKVD